MSDFKKLASVLVGYSTKVKPGELVCIRYESLAEELAVAVYKEAVRAGGHVFFDAMPEGATEAFYELASDKQLDFLNPHSVWLREKPDVLFNLLAPANTKSLSSVDPARIARRAAANRKLSDIFMARQASGKLRWVLTEIATQAGAQDAAMSLDQYQDFVAQAGSLHLDDPAAYWQKFHTWQQTVADDLNNNRKKIHIKGPSIDLQLSVEGRKWVNCSGQYNFPDGEVFTGPVETSANGWLQLKFPAVYNGNEVTDARLEFENGRVIRPQPATVRLFLMPPWTLIPVPGCLVS